VSDMNVMARNASKRLVILMCAASLTAAWAESSSDKEITSSYGGIGRIKWKLPENFNFRSSAREFTRGQRIRCTDGQQECVISVGVRVISITPEQRRKQLADKLFPLVAHSSERSLRYRTQGTDDALVYVTLTDTRPDQKFRLKTMGYRLNGPAVINFEHFTNDQSLIQKILDVVLAAESLDAREMWAWKLADYKSVCQEHFPEFSSANTAAFDSSTFASVDIIQFFQSLASRGPETVRAELEKGRASYAKIFDKEPLEWKRNFCKNYPAWVAEAAQGIPSK
jgi:hypothetical protein